MKEALAVEVWFDLICPWCWIGRRRFERALADALLGIRDHDAKHVTCLRGDDAYLTQAVRNARLQSEREHGQQMNAGFSRVARRLVERRQRQQGVGDGSQHSGQCDVWRRDRVGRKLEDGLQSWVVEPEIGAPKHSYGLK